MSPAGGPRPVRPGKKLVIFADGTGNAFSVQESNVWRLYQALDKSEKPEALMQLARYIPGVGTSGNAVIRAIDGATGIGVPSNVRKLYRFLCWNWQPGDEIYLFGFSRGAFTVRTLAGMISMQGLMPCETEAGRVSGPDMSRNAMAAWLAYRTMTAPFVAQGTSPWNPLNWKMNPVTSLVRTLRDRVTNLTRRALGRQTHQEILAAMPAERQAGQVAIRFLGLFDTVEAYGMPVEGMTRLWNWLVWPIRFRNQRASYVVQKVRHALSLDDERRSFHPIRFDVSARPDGKPVPETQELWFAGVHSDVGGGYPDDETAFEPLLWLAGEAARQELIFDIEALNRYRRQLYPQAMIHDSRAGMASLYRYAPRKIDADPRHGGPPVVHHSVVGKMEAGASGYAPVVLPEEVLVYPARGAGWVGLAPFDKTRDPEVASDLQRLVRRRKSTNWLTILLVLVLAAVPVWDWARGTEIAPSGILRGVAAVLGGLVPGWAVTWVEALLGKLWLTLPVLGLIWAIYRFNQTLAYRIRDRAGKLWRPRG